MCPEPLLEVRDLCKSFNRREVVSSVCFHVEEGEIFGLLGPNGAGKTTTFRMTMGQLRADSGSVYFDGYNITKKAMHERALCGMGYLSQEPSVFNNLSVEDNIMAILEYHEKDREKRRERREELLNLLSLAEHRKKMAASLSGGQRRRLEVTRCLVTHPKLLMLDEPFSGIDPKAVIDIKEILQGLKERGISVLITDHNVHETLSLVDRGAILYEGKIFVEGSPNEIAEDKHAREVYLGDDFKLR